MSHFNFTIPKILKHEGGWVDDPQDAGGATNWGISLRYAQGLPLRLGDIDEDGDIDRDDIRALSRPQAIQIYQYMYERVGFYDRIHNQVITCKVFDLHVNMGARRVFRGKVIGGAWILAQRAVRASSGARLKLDGLIGPQTVRAINYCLPGEFLAALCSEAAGYYLSLNRPRFERGWLNRAYWRPDRD